MFKQKCAAALVAVTALGVFTTAAAQVPKQADGGQKQITNFIGMKLTLVPPGEFEMGSSESARQTAAFFKANYVMDHLSIPTLADVLRREHPQHRVRLTKPFYLGTFHVTRGEFRKFISDSGYKTDAERVATPGAGGWDPRQDQLVFKSGSSWRSSGFQQTDEHPVVNVSWFDATAFCKWLSRKEGKTYRLPTEAEWEYACRAGTKTRYYSGDNPETLAKVGNIADAAYRAKFPGCVSSECAIRESDGYVFTAPVGQLRPNAFGLYDMVGNAWQWCADWYDEDYYGGSPPQDPKGPETGYYRVVRGGCWFSCPAFALSTARGGTRPDDPNNGTGFRVAMDAPGSLSAGVGKK